MSVRGRLRRVLRAVDEATWPVRVLGKTKFFCVGQNKTGTTSIKKAFLDLGFIVANQRKAEFLTDSHYFDREWRPIIHYCRSAQVFQDVPFSLPGTFRALDDAFPGSKFVLTMRDSPEEWYGSLVAFHSLLWGLDGRIPTAEDLDRARMRNGLRKPLVMRIYGTSPDAPYDRETLIAHYRRHNHEIIQHFSDRPDDLLVVNLKDADAYPRFLRFVGVTSKHDRFPWENRTSDRARARH